MIICWRFLWLSGIFVALVSRAAFAQTKTPQPDQTTSIAVPDTVGLAFSRPGGEGWDARSMELMNALLGSVNPAEIAAPVFDISVDKIEVVPHIYWREAKWTDWAKKAEHTPPPDNRWAGPDGKLVMSGQVGPYGNLQLEFGPVPWKNPADSEKFRQAEYQVLQRVAAKMIRQAPEFSRVFERHKLAVDFDRLYQRLRELNSEIEKLRLEIGGESGLSPAQLAERLADLSKQELATRLSLDVMKARSGALREQIDKIKVTAELKVAENQSIRTLKRIVDLRKARFENLKQQKSQGVVPQADVDKGEEEMLAAMVEVDRATASQQKDASQAQLDQLPGELSKVSVDFAEAEARIHFLDSAVGETEKQLADRRIMDSKADELRSRLTALERRRSQLQQQRNQAEDALNEPIEPLQLTLPER